MPKQPHTPRGSAHVVSDRFKTRLAGAVLLASLLGLSCSSGRVTSPRLVLTLIADPVPLPGVRLFGGEDSAGAELELLLIVGGPVDLYRTRFEFAYPVDLVRVDSVTEGDLLSEGGEVETRFDVQQRPGLVSIDHTRVGDVGSLNQPGLFTTMAVIRLTAVTSGSGRFSFPEHEVFDENGDPVPGYTWGGAELVSEL